MNKLIILVDYNKYFQISLNDKNEYISMNVEKIKNIFINKGFIVEVVEYSKLDLNRNYNGYYIIYQTSETKEQYYKKYIEDLIFFLQINGALLLPEYKYLKAHHNKGFMELLRKGFSDPSLKTISSKYYGTPIEALNGTIELPLVIKKIAGAGSSGVFCAKSINEYKKNIFKASSTIIEDNYIKLHIEFIKILIKKIISLFNSKYRKRLSKKTYRPFIVQNFIQGLPGDYKVLYFGGKYYTLYRENRKKDFRASGGGRLFHVPIQDNYFILDFAERVVNEINQPIIGMDIGFDGQKYHLIEFQMIHLGPYTLQRSDYYFIWRDGRWQCINEKSNLEEEYCRSIYEYISNTRFK